MQRNAAAGLFTKPSSLGEGIFQSDMGLKVQMYTKEGCHLCVVAREIILRVLEEIPFEFQEVDIESRNDLYERFKEEIPVVFVNGKRVFTYRVHERKLRRILKRYQPMG